MTFLHGRSAKLLSETLISQPLNANASSLLDIIGLSKSIPSWRVRFKLPPRYTSQEDERGSFLKGNFVKPSSSARSMQNQNAIMVLPKMPKNMFL
jgi:hypothetical protein